jgi:hypothetical protein
MLPDVALCRINATYSVILDRCDRRSGHDVGRPGVDPARATVSGVSASGNWSANG